MKIPDFPESEKISIGHKQLFDKAFFNMNPKNSEFTFTNLFLWGSARGYKLSMFLGHILVSEKHGAYFCPIGPYPADAIAEFLRINSSAVFHRVPEEFAEKLDRSLFRVEEDSDHWDYVYKRQDLSELKGAKYYPKRSFSERAMQYNPVVVQGEKISPEECEKLQNEWLDSKEGEINNSLKEENHALRLLFENRENLGVLCVGILIDGSLAAFSAGEPLNGDTFVVHFEKAKSGYTGLYQLINREFSRSVPKKFSYINREQDLGIAGLRKAKQSYYPAFMVKKYTVKKA